MQIQTPSGNSTELQKTDAKQFFRSLVSSKVVERSTSRSPSFEVFYQSGPNPLVFQFYVTDDVVFSLDGTYYQVVQPRDFFEWLATLDIKEVGSEADSAPKNE